jgi:hypothetical protein
MNFIANNSHNLKFHLFYIINWNFLVSNFLKNSFHFERVDIFILGSDKHSCDTNSVQIIDLFDISAILKISIHQWDSMEKCLIIAFEICKHLDHPVDHTSSHCWIYHKIIMLVLVSLKEACNFILIFRFL